MVGEMDQQDGVVRCDSVEIEPGRLSVIGEVQVVVADGDDPFAFLPALGQTADLRQDRRERAEGRSSYFREVRVGGSEAQMVVSIDEARVDGLAGQIVLIGSRGRSPYVFEGAGARHASCREANGRYGGVGVIHRVYDAVVQNLFVELSMPHARRPFQRRMMMEVTRVLRNCSRMSIAQR